MAFNMVRRRRPRYYKSELKDILKTIFSGQISGGKHTALFEDKFAEYIGTRFALATCTGRSALSLILDALELKEGDEIIMPAYTLKDLIELVKGKGLAPKLVDVEKDSFNLDPNLVLAQITHRTRAVIATHLFGLPCDIEKIVKIANQYNIAVIEDCAHSLGATLKGRRTGSFADAAFFSFETIKGINTFGGGMVTTNNEKIAQKVKASLGKYPASGRGILGKILFSYLEDLLIRSPAYPVLIRAFRSEGTAKAMGSLYLSMHSVARINKARFTNLQAFLGLRQLDLLEKRNKNRTDAARELEKRLNKYALLQRGRTPGDRIFYFFVIKLIPGTGKIEEIIKRLIDKGVDAGIRNEITDNCAKYLNQEDRYPITKEIYESSIQLPLYDDMSEREIVAITDALNKVLTSKGELK